jgi:hypothetical protein
MFVYSWCHIPDRPIDIDALTMSARRMKVSKCPSDALTMTNRAVVSPSDFDPKASMKTTIIFVALLMAPTDTLTCSHPQRKGEVNAFMVIL